MKTKEIPKLSEDDKNRFWKHVNIAKPNECWEWKTTKHKLYPSFMFNRTMFQAHRIAYYLSNHRDPGILLVCHTCDNKKCCNPHHLFLGNFKINADDMYAKKRGVDNKGEKHGMSTLTNEIVNDIRKLHDLGYNQREIASIHNIHQCTVSRLINRLRWKHI
jgi:hypothetical protein